MYSYGHPKRVVGTTGTLTRGAAGSGAFLDRIIVGKFVALAVVTVYNGVDATGEVVATIDASTIESQGTYEFGALMDNGFHVTVTGGAAEITVVYH